MLVLKWVWTETGKEAVDPQIAFYTLRLLMFILSFVLEDWAIHELVQSPRERRLALLLVGSSYATWTYQTHTFSNSVETLVVLWSLVMVQRILDNKVRPSLLTAVIAITVDTNFYNRPLDNLVQTLRTNPIITPLNAIVYNASASNLSLHGLHPLYQHMVASLPLLLGPALFLLGSIRKPTLPILTALSATVLLSVVPHQEPRFLLPVVPLFLSSISLPKSMLLRKYWLGTWVTFNAVLGVLMGIYHQGGVIPAQLWLGHQQQYDLGFNEVYWWRTYSPPIWALDGKDVATVDLMGMNAVEMIDRVVGVLGNCTTKTGYESVALVAPLSSIELDAWQEDSRDIYFERIWTSNHHLNLDDLDMQADGFWGTMKRTVGRRGLVIWRVGKSCM
ncbi:MAG: hypothetical protein Q9219_001730 [cf. Caloplaca sp. 3 TL-2023]